MGHRAELSLKIGSQLFKALQPAGRHEDSGALTGESASTGSADARTRPCDKNDLVAKRSHRQPPRILLYKNFHEKTGVFCVKILPHFVDPTIQG